MNTVVVTMLETVGEYAKGEQYEIDEATADKWEVAGLCEVVENPEGKAFDKFSKALETKLNDVVENVSKSINSINIKMPAAPKTDDKSLGEFLALVGKTGSKDNRKKESAYNTLVNKYAAKTAMTQGGDTAGGFLVPEEWATELLSVEGFGGAAYPDRVRVIPMQTDKLYVPTLDQTVSPSNGSSAFVAGVSIGVVSEGSAPANPTLPAFKQLALTAKKLLAYTQVSSELIDNSPISVENIVTDSFRKAVVSWVDHRIFNGDASADDLTGIIDHGATIKVARETTGKITLLDMAKLWSRLAPQSMSKAAYFINPVALAQLPLLGNANHLVWVQNGVNGGFDLRFAGIPIVPCESMPALGNAGDVVLADMRYYILGLNKDVTVDASPDFAFTSDLTTYRVKVRLDGKPQLTAPIYLQNGTDTVSPFVQLDDSGS